MSFYALEEVPTPHFAWEMHLEDRWILPGVRCPGCGRIFGGVGEAYPSLDLSSVPNAKKFQARVEEDFAEFNRLREQVRPLAPPGAPLIPGTRFGPLTGSASGTLPELVLPNPWTLIVREASLKALHDEGLQDLKGTRAPLRFRSKPPPFLLELEIETHGRLHPACLPPGGVRACPTCGRPEVSLPSSPLLDAASLPSDRSLFRPLHFPTLIIATRHFVEAVERLGLSEVAFRELPVR